MWIEVHDANPVDPNHPETTLNSDYISNIWQHPMLGCMVEIDAGIGGIQNVNTTETYAQVRTLLGA